MDVTAQQQVAAEVRAQLARKRLSGRSAALELGWTQPYISRRLTGEVPFDVNDLAALAALLEIPMTAFFEVPDRIWIRRPDGYRDQLRKQPLAVAA